MILKYEYFAIQIQRTWNVKAKVILVITGLKQPSQNTQTVPEQHTGKARYRGITETSHIVHCTQTVGSADVKVQNIFHGRNSIRCNTNCKYRTYSYIIVNGLHKSGKNIYYYYYYYYYYGTKNLRNFDVGFSFSFKPLFLSVSFCFHYG